MDLEKLSDKQDFEEIEQEHPQTADAIKMAVYLGHMDQEGIERFFVNRGKGKELAAKCGRAARHLIREKKSPA